MSTEIGNPRKGCDGVCGGGEVSERSSEFRIQRTQPKSRKFHVGQVLYEVSVDDLTGDCKMERWQVRTIRGSKVTAIHLNPWTWVKLSKRHGDWGWAKRIDEVWRRTWPIPEVKWGLGSNLHTTKKSAWKAVLADVARKESGGSCWYLESPEVLARVKLTATRQSEIA